MLLAYALESRSSWWTFVFAISCLNASAYALLSGSWPFAAVEAIWALVAFKRWINTRSGKVFFLHAISSSELLERAGEMKGHPAHGPTKRFLQGNK